MRCSERTAGCHGLANVFAADGLTRRTGCRTASAERGRGITWTHSYWGEVATGIISADMSGRHEDWFRIQLGSLDQRIILVSRPRHFGGRQWHFVCPVMNRLAAVLWKPSGATRFCSRQPWGRQVAYQSQFNDATNRAHAGQGRIKARLCSIGGLDPDDWDLPPKPKWSGGGPMTGSKPALTITKRCLMTAPPRWSPDCSPNELRFEINTPG